MKGVTDFRRIWLGACFVGFALLLLSSSSGRDRTWNPVEQFIVEITTPFQRIVKQTVYIVDKFWNTYFYLVNARLENVQLKREVNTLRLENNRHRELLNAYERLKKLLQFRHTIQRPVMPAQVIGRDPTGWFRSIIIDKGSRDGIISTMPVVDSCGVVGRIVSVSPHCSKILLIIDQNSAVDCLVQRSRDRGMVKGLSTEACKLDFVVKSADVAIGDIVITSGLGSIFPKGLPVGTVSGLKERAGELFKDIEIRPSVDFSRLEEVLVILKEDKSLDQKKKN